MIAMFHITYVPQDSVKAFNVATKVGYVVVDVRMADLKSAIDAMLDLWQRKQACIGPDHTRESLDGLGAHGGRLLGSLCSFRDALDDLHSAPG